MPIESSEQGEDRIGKAVTDDQSDTEELLLNRDSDLTPTLSVVLPTLNEEQGIKQCIEKIKFVVRATGLPTEILVSDSSTDRTPEIAARNGAIVVEPDEPGYGNAYKHAFRHARGEYIAIGDADTTYDFEELPALLQLAMEDGTDLVLGSRLEGDIKPGAMPPLHRYVGNPLLTRFLNTFYDAGVSDAHSGMRVITADALRQLELRSGGMEFASEMIMDAATKELTIAEVPITYHEREGEATLDSFSDGWRHVKFMLINAPGYVFSGPALAVGLIGFLIIAASLAGLELGAVNFGLQTLLGGLLFVMIAYQAASLAVFSSAAADPIREPRDPVTETITESLTFESGTLLGAGLALLGLGVLGYGAIIWVVQGYSAVPGVTWNLLAVGATCLGLQTVFNAVFISLLGQHTE